MRDEIFRRFQLDGENLVSYALPSTMPAGMGLGPHTLSSTGPRAVDEAALLRRSPGRAAARQWRWQLPR